MLEADCGCCCPGSHRWSPGDISRLASAPETIRGDGRVGGAFQGRTGRSIPRGTGTTAPTAASAANARDLVMASAARRMASVTRLRGVGGSMAGDCMECDAGVAPRADPKCSSAGLYTGGSDCRNSEPYQFRIADAHPGHRMGRVCQETPSLVPTSVPSGLWAMLHRPNPHTSQS